MCIKYISEGEYYPSYTGMAICIIMCCGCLVSNFLNQFIIMIYKTMKNTKSNWFEKIETKDNFKPQHIHYNQEAVLE